jgi:hypothetical protein
MNKTIPTPKADLDAVRAGDHQPTGFQLGEAYLLAGYPEDDEPLLERIVLSLWFRLFAMPALVGALSGLLIWWLFVRPKCG